MGINWWEKDHRGEGSFVSEAPGTALCDKCDFVKWGRWGSGLGSNAQLGGMWVAGDIASAGDLNELGNQHATANYAGKAVGDVYKKIDGSWGQPAEATGRMEMFWDFADRNGRLDISNFDGKSFGGIICGAGGQCPDASKHFAGPNHFVGSLSDNNNLTGAAAGSFVNNGRKSCRRYR